MLLDACELVISKKSTLSLALDVAVLVVTWRLVVRTRSLEGNHQRLN
jgi:hypothetical protein